VEFARKSSSQAALKKCQNECLLLSATPIPVVVTPLESRDEEEGVLEKSVLHAADYRQERELGPRFADPGSMEWEVSQ
jgi:proline- and glutamine-rich splicing factor